MSHDPDSRLTHVDSGGRSHMVDVGAKPETLRRARARAVVVVSEAADQALRQQALPKGSADEVVRMAGIAGAKRTSELIPLCHPLRLTGVEVRLSAAGDRRWHVETEVRAVDRTGVEMEAMTAAAVGALALYDMVKAVDRSAVVERIELLEKAGGKSGHWVSSEAER